MTASLLEVRGLTVRFGGVVALDGLELDVRPREILGLIGPNGSGKTTCFNVITGLLRPDAGRVVFAGDDITGRGPQEVYRRGIARTFQRSRLYLELSVFDNVALGNWKRLDSGFLTTLLRRRRLARQFTATLEETRALLEVFAPPLIDRLWEPVARLPMIDRRRIEICRALVGRPRLLLLDEPSAGMTEEEMRELMDDLLVVRERYGDLAIVLIEHEMGVIERVTDRCVVLNYGRKIAEGDYRSVARDPEVRSAYLGTDA